ncbi:helix-turn-helix domain-containing protein [Paenibacillus solisilvae]|uniref:Helix-turn-helix domain-containing protein n=1 Tax=Paenibacillus solisilvae TaxID=2486751 RepID=A0ABW0W3A4_9BACL
MPPQQLYEMTPHVGTARFYQYNGDVYERHRLGNCYAFHLFMGGGGHAFMRVEDRTIALDKGMLVFVRPGVGHSFHVSADDQVQSHNVYCDLWQQDGFISDLPQFTFPPNPYHSETGTLEATCPELDRLPVSVSLAAYPHLLDNFVYLSRTANEPRVYRQCMLDSLFYAWLLELHHTLFALRPKDQRILRILRKIDAHPERAACHVEWSKACGLKKSYFYELFKQETGIPVHAYVVQARLKKAAAMLQETSRSVTSVAAELGYSSIHHFSRQFTARFGVSPSRYRAGAQIAGYGG